MNKEEIAEVARVAAQEVLPERTLSLTRSLTPGITTLIF